MLKHTVIWLFFFFAFSCYAIEETPVDTPPKDLLQKPWTGTLEVTTNYLSEGISNTNNSPAIQGNFLYSFGNTGIYVDLLGTNTDFVAPKFEHATVEFDTIIGITNNINKDWNYNIYFDRYNYPGAPDANYTDFITALTYKIITFTTYYSPNVFGSGGTGIYLNGSLIYDIPEKYIFFSNLSALASLGHYQLPASTGMYSYYNYMMGLQKEIKPFILSLLCSTTSDANVSPYDGMHIVGTLLFTF